jgi:hypothetical protein
MDGWRETEVREGGGEEGTHPGGGRPVSVGGARPARRRSRGGPLQQLEEDLSAKEDEVTPAGEEAAAVAAAAGSHGRRLPRTGGGSRGGPRGGARTRRGGGGGGWISREKARPHLRRRLRPPGRRRRRPKRRSSCLLGRRDRGCRRAQGRRYARDLAAAGEREGEQLQWQASAARRRLAGRGAGGLCKGGGIGGRGGAEHCVAQWDAATRWKTHFVASFVHSLSLFSS